MLEASCVPKVTRARSCAVVGASALTFYQQCNVTTAPLLARKSSCWRRPFIVRVSQFKTTDNGREVETRSEFYPGPCASSDDNPKSVKLKRVADAAEILKRFFQSSVQGINTACEAVGRRYNVESSSRIFLRAGKNKDGYFYFRVGATEGER